MEMGEGGVEARLGTPIVVGGKGKLLRGKWSGREGWCGLGCSVGESLLIVGKEVIWVWEDGSVLEAMGNEGMGKDGMMVRWGVNWRVVLVCIAFSQIENGIKGEREGMAIHL